MEVFTSHLNGAFTLRDNETETVSVSVSVSGSVNTVFTLTETETDKKWLVQSCVELFILHQDTSVSGYCSYFIGLGLYYGSFTLTDTATKTDTDTDKMCTEPNRNLHRSLSDHYEHLHTVLHKPFLIGLGHSLCQCKHTIMAYFHQRRWIPVRIIVLSRFFHWYRRIQSPH